MCSHSFFSNNCNENIILKPVYSQSGITYYAPQTQPQPRPILSQRRHTNAIPIMAPPERNNKGVNRSMGGASSAMGNNDSNNNSNNDQQQAVDSTAENIDHILDNMFVQRSHPYQSTTGLSSRKSSSPSPAPIDVQQVSKEILLIIYTRYYCYTNYILFTN